MATETGERAGPLVMTATDGEALWSVGALLVLKADAEQTNGEYTLVEYTADAGYETPYHVHHAEDELFYVLEGEIECYYGDDGEDVIRVGPDDTVFLPRDVPHGFRVISEQDCRMLVIVTPAGLEAFFREVGIPAERLETPPPGEPDLTAMTEAATAYDLEILGMLPE